MSGLSHPVPGDASATRARRKALERLRVQSVVENRPGLGPQTVHFDIVNACNTRCTTCWHHSPYLAPAYRPDAR